MKLFSVLALAAIPLMPMQCDGGNSSPNTGSATIINARIYPESASRVITGASGWVDGEVMCRNLPRGDISGRQLFLQSVPGPTIWHPGGGDMNNIVTVYSVRCIHTHPYVQLLSVWSWD